MRVSILSLLLLFAFFSLVAPVPTFAAGFSRINRSLTGGTISASVSPDAPGEPCVFLIENCTATADITFEVTVANGCRISIHRNTFVNARLRVEITFAITPVPRDIVAVVRENNMTYSNARLDADLIQFYSSVGVEQIAGDATTSSIAFVENTFTIKDGTSNMAAAASNPPGVAMIRCGGVCRAFRDVAFTRNVAVIDDASTPAAAAAAAQWIFIRLFTYVEFANSVSSELFTINNNRLHSKQQYFVAMLTISPNCASSFCAGFPHRSRDMVLSDNELRLQGTSSTANYGAAIFFTDHGALNPRLGDGGFIRIENNFRVERNEILADSGGSPSQGSIMIVDVTNITVGNHFSMRRNSITVSGADSTNGGGIVAVACLGDTVGSRVATPHANSVFALTSMLSLDSNGITLRSGTTHGFVGMLAITNIAVSYLELKRNFIDVRGDNGIDGTVAGPGESIGIATVCVLCIGPPRKAAASPAVRAESDATIARATTIQIESNSVRSRFPTPSVDTHRYVLRTVAVLYVDSGLAVQNQINLQTNTIQDYSSPAQPQPPSSGSSGGNEVSDAACLVCIYCQSNSAPESETRFFVSAFSNTITVASANVTASLFRSPVNGRLLAPKTSHMVNVVYGNRAVVPRGAYGAAHASTNMTPEQLKFGWASSAIAQIPVMSTGRGNWSYYLIGSEADSCNRIEVDSVITLLRASVVEAAMGFTSQTTSSVWPINDRCIVNDTTTIPSTTVAAITSTTSTSTATSSTSTSSTTSSTSTSSTTSSTSTSSTTSSTSTSSTTTTRTTRATTSTTSTTTTTTTTMAPRTPAPRRPFVVSPTRTCELTASPSLPPPSPYEPPGLPAAEQAAVLTTTGTVGVIVGGLVSPGSALSVARGAMIFSLAGCPEKAPSGVAWIEAPIAFPESFLPGVGLALVQPSPDDPWDRSHLHGNHARTAVVSFFVFMCLACAVALASGYFSFFGLREGCSRLTVLCTVFSAEWWTTLLGVSPVPHLAGLATSQVCASWLRCVGLLFGSVTTLKFFFIDAIFFGLVPVAIVGACWFLFFRNFSAVVAKAGQPSLGIVTSVVTEYAPHRAEAVVKLEKALLELEGEELRKRVELLNKAEWQNEQREEQSQSGLNRGDCRDDEGSLAAAAAVATALPPLFMPSAIDIETEESVATTTAARADDVDNGEIHHVEHQEDAQQQQQQQQQQQDPFPSSSSSSRAAEQEPRLPAAPSPDGEQPVPSQTVATEAAEAATGAESILHSRLADGLLVALQQPTAWKAFLLKALNSRVGRFCLVGDVCWDTGPSPHSKAKVLWMRSPCIIARIWGSEKEFSQNQVESMLDRKQRKKIKHYIIQDVGHFRAESVVHQHRFDSASGFLARISCFEEARQRLAPHTFLFQLIITVLSGFLTGVAQAQPQKACTAILYLLALLNIISFLFTFFTRPFVIPLYNVLVIWIEFVTMLAALLALQRSSQAAAVLQMFVGVSLIASSLVLAASRLFRWMCLLLTRAAVQPLHAYEKGVHEIVSKENNRREQMRAREAAFLAAQREGTEEKRQRKSESDSAAAAAAGAATSATGNSDVPLLETSAPLLDHSEQGDRAATAEAQEQQLEQRQRQIADEEIHNADIDDSVRAMGRIISSSMSASSSAAADWQRRFNRVDRWMRRTHRPGPAHHSSESDRDNDGEAAGADGGAVDSDLEELVAQQEAAKKRDPAMMAYTFHRRELDQLFIDL